MANSTNARIDKLLSRFGDPQTPDRDAMPLLVEIEKLPPTEPAGRWADIANDARLSPQRRRQALLAFFRRHARPGVLLHDVLAIRGMALWFAPGRVHDRTHAAKLPFDRRRGACVLMVRPEIPAGDDTAVFVLLSAPVDPSNLSSNSGARIVDVAFSNG